MKIWHVKEPAPDSKFDGESEIKYTLIAVEITEDEGVDGRCRQLARIKITPELPECEALALADRVMADPSLIGVHPRIAVYTHRKPRERKGAK